MQEAIGIPLDSFLKNTNKSYNIKYLLADASQKNDKNRIPRVVKVKGDTVYVSMFLNTAPKEKEA